MRRIVVFTVMLLCFVVAGVSIYEIIYTSNIVKNKDTEFPGNVPYKKNNLKVGQVTLRWDKVSDATSYNVYWSETSGVNKNNGNKISAETNSVTIKNLELGTTYYFVVTAGNKSAESDVSKEFSYTVGE